MFSLAETRFLTLREYTLAKHGHDTSKIADFRAYASLHGVNIDEKVRPKKRQILSEDEIGKRVKAIMEG